MVRHSVRRCKSIGREFEGITGNQNRREGQQQGSHRSGAVPAFLGEDASALASILAVRDTGMLLNGEPVLGIDLSIRGPNRESIRARSEGPVPAWALSDAVVGAEVKVRCSADEPMLVSIDWENPSRS